jgi:hypothetical protein
MRDETTTRKIYTFNELTDQAKETAREWWRAHVDTADYSTVIEDAVRMGVVLGIEISSPNIYWSGFSSQGDGACFEGAYSYKIGAVKALKAGDEGLLRIAEGLQAVQARTFYQLTAMTHQQGRYNHSGCMAVDVGRKDHRDFTIEADEALLIQLLRDFADWIYSQLDAENDYINSDENVDESIRCNEYEFTEDGQRA